MDSTLTLWGRLAEPASGVGDPALQPACPAIQWLSNELTFARPAPIASASLERGQTAALLVLRLSLETQRQARGLRRSLRFRSIAAKKPAARILRVTSRAEHGNKTMFAVIKTGGKQYKVAADNQITVMSLPGEAGGRSVFDGGVGPFGGAPHPGGAPP